MSTTGHRTGGAQRHLHANKEIKIVRGRRSLNLALTLSLLISTAPVIAMPAAAASPDIVISQVYGGGGNSGATLTNDYVELFNRGTTAVSLAGWSVQYASSAGTTWQVTALSGTVQPGQYYLVRQAAGAGGTTPLPTPDAVGSIAMSGTSGKVALSTSSTALSGTCPTSVHDLVGYGSANCFEGAGAAGTLSNATAAIREGAGCTDTDVNASDFSVSSPSPRNSSSPLNPCSGSDSAPVVSSTVPADQSTDIPVDANVEVIFSEPVDVTGTWFDLTCENSGPHAASVSGGPTSFSLDPAVDFALGEVCTVTVVAAQVSDQDTQDPPDTMEADVVFSFSTAAVNACELPFTAIYEIQGSGSSAAITGPLTTQGVVVGDFEGPSPTLRGFYIQDATGDGDVSTSDGLFVFNGNADEVGLGDIVRVSGSAGEFQGQTQLSNVTNITSCGDGEIVPVDVTLPFTDAAAPERYEGMLVRMPQTLSVTEHFQLGRFGQVVMSSGGRLSQPTNVVAPGAPANELQTANGLNQIIFDDALQNQNPDPILFGRDGLPLSASNTLRGGDTATNTIGVMTYTWAGNAASGNAYRLRPIGALNGFVEFEGANGRPATPADVGGSLKVGSLNLLNYFNTFDGIPDNVDNCSNGLGGAATDCRGADNQGEFDRQWPKTVAAIVGMDVDVLGVNEIENDGYGTDSAIAHLVDRLNEATTPGTYDFVDFDAATGQVNALGTDAIKVGLIYRPGQVTPVGTSAVLNTPAFVNAGDSAERNRATFAQAFEQPNGARFVVSTNHLKSKGSACDAPDAGDGQGNCNDVRENAANVLADWLATDPTETLERDVLIIGDLNSYAKEDPVVALEDAGFANLIESFLGPDAYSFVFSAQWGYLDHALGSPTIISQVTGVAEWHINADEPGVLDYNTNFKSVGQIADLYAPDQFRVSDHDPVIVGLDLEVFAFEGLFAPVAGPPALNDVKAGRVVPIKFGLGADEGLDIVFDGYPRSQDVDCSTLTPLAGSNEISSPGGATLSYDPADGTYTLPWKTDKSWRGTCRVFRLLLDDGGEHIAYFRFG